MELSHPLFFDVVYETPDYFVRVIKLADTPYNTYGVVHKTWEVVEGVQTVLTQAQDMADMFQKWVDDRKKKEEHIFLGEEALLNVTEQA